MKGCFEEGILQAYIDNELPPETAERVASHAASCQTCALALDEAAGEMAIFSRAIEAEMSLGVPSERLRERVETAIGELNRPARISEPKREGFGSWLASLAGMFKVSPQRAIGFASLIAVVAFAALFAVIKTRKIETGETPDVQVAINDTRGGKTPVMKPSPAPTPETQNGNKPEGETPQEKQKRRKQAKPIFVPEPDQLPRDEQAKGNTPLPGEENYLKAIETLKAEIAANGNDSLKPSMRAEFERNLAVVDQAIVSTQRTARRNRSDRDAAEFLYSSYQNKLDLLQTVAEQARPTIAIR